MKSTNYSSLYNSCRAAWFCVREYVGALPAPALAHFGIQNCISGIMVTGSHIPFDRNGIKFYREDGEISKAGEQSIMDSTVSLPYSINLLDLPKINSAASELYLTRFTYISASDFLKGKTIAVFERSGVARDSLSALFKALGAEVISFGAQMHLYPSTPKRFAQKIPNKLGYGLQNIQSTCLSQRMVMQIDRSSQMSMVSSYAARLLAFSVRNI